MKNSPQTPDARTGVASNDAPLKKPAPHAPEGSRKDETPDDGVSGRDRLSENEDRRMDPGVSDSSHA